MHIFSHSLELADMCSYKNSYYRPNKGLFLLTKRHLHKNQQYVKNRIKKYNLFQ